MTMPIDDGAPLSPLKQALLAIERLQARIEGLEHARREPIAVVGIGCRFPGGADDPAAFWRLLCAGEDAVSEVPPERWDVEAFYDPDPEAPGKMSSRFGAWLRDVDRFDPQHFGIAPREAAGMDPQQRLILEVAWEALERAGQAPDRLSGSRTGVYLGIIASDYAQLEGRVGAADQIDPYFGSGNAHSVASGRISYVLGLEGPSLSIDTACSSSLVAIHLAVQSLRLGEIDMALAGGVNLMLSPETSIALSKLRMLAPDGRCKTFDARADGYVRGEGAALIVLKRLSDALAHRDPIAALILGSAVNQDGASSGLTVPNGPAQAAVIRAALRDAGVTPADVSFVEAHGTGTALGDPLEVRALVDALGPGRAPDRPIHLGSVKTNIGHLEAAAGVAGLIKAALALRERAIPPHLHLASPNPYLPWERLPVEIPTRLVPWPEGAPRVAGVSSFGFSGTNAHIVLAAAPQPAEPATTARPSHVLCLSAGSEAALRVLAERYAGHLAGTSDAPTANADAADVAGAAAANGFDASPAGVTDADLADFCFTANAGRASLSHRIAVPVLTVDEALTSLRVVARGEVPPGAARGHAAGGDPPRIAFLFTGQGAQYAGMGRRLYETQSAFRMAVDHCDTALRELLDPPLLAILFPDRAGGVDAGLIDDTAYTQPALFALQMALVELWRSWGIAPDVVMGHSAGELAAAAAAGVYSLEDGLRLSAARGRLMSGLPRDGAMAAVRADEARVQAAITARALGGPVAIAAVNGPADVVLSGQKAALDAVLEALEREGIASRRLNVSHAFHSPLMDPILDNLARAAAAVSGARPRVPWIGNLTGNPVTMAELEGGAYWRDQARSPVRFADGMAALRGLEIDVVVEIGPDPVLLGMSRRGLPGDQRTWLASLRRGRDPWETLTAAAAALWARGVPVDWEGFDRDEVRRRIALPTYPFQRSRYWVTPPSAGAMTSGSAADPRTLGMVEDQVAGRVDRHPLLGARLASPLAEWQFEAWLDPARLAYVRDHRVSGQVILPGAGFLALALAAAEHVAPERARDVADVVIGAALPFGAPQASAELPGPPRRVQTIVAQGEGEDLALRVFALDPGATDGGASGTASWSLHASARLIAAPQEAISALECDAPATVPAALGAIRARCIETVGPEEHRAQLRARGFDFGPSLLGVTGIRRRDGEALGHVRLPDGLVEETAPYVLHPALLDACLQVVGAALPKGTDDSTPYLPLAVDRFRVHRRPQEEVLSHVVLSGAEEGGPGALLAPADGIPGDLPDTITADVHILDPTGAPVADLLGLRLVRAAVRDRGAQRGIDDWLYEVAWHPRPLPGTGQGSGTATGDAALLAAGLAPWLATRAADERLEDYRSFVEQLDAVVALYVRQAFTQLGWDPRPGEIVAAGALAARLGIQPRYYRLVNRLLAILAEDGYVAAKGERYEVSAWPPAIRAGDETGLGAPPDPVSDADAALVALRAAHPQSAPIELAERCGPRLADVLAGRVDPLDLLFPGGSTATAERLYKDSAEARAFQATAAEALAGALGAATLGRAAGHRPRVLEVGAGTGGTTAYALPRLSGMGVRYTFTDISPHFLDRARAAFADHPDVEYRALDIEREPAAQGFAPGTYDVVLAANVVHATADLRQALDHVRTLLAPGGLLVLLESTAPEPWLDITFGLTDGWWRFTDRRRDGPLADADAWRGYLAEAGFGDAAVVTVLPGLSHQAILIAQASFDPLAGTWLVLADAEGVGARLAERLAAAGASPRVVHTGATLAIGDDGLWRANPSRRDDLARVVEAVARADPPLRGVVYLWGLDMQEPGDAESSLEPALRSGLGGALHLVQALVGAEIPGIPRLWLTTRGAWALAPGPTDGAGGGELGTPRAETDRSVLGRCIQAPLWGFGRVVGLEHPELGCVQVDLDPAADLDTQAAALLAEVSRPHAEDALAYRGGARHVARLIRSKPAPRPADRSASVRLVADRGGVLDAIRCVSAERRAPGPGEVEIRVQAAGLSFRDLLNALAVRDDPDPLGSECAGRVTALGAGVGGLRVGDAVVALAAGSLGGFATTDARLVAPLPAGIDFAGGATLPTAFLTAEYALRAVAGLARGERVLIHAAAGGVGQAAVQIALRIGAEVVATAGSPEKRAYLATMGISHVLDSRSLEFADAVLRLTEGRGVDVVLNQLGGDFIPAGLRALADDGRFVEIGKRGIWTAAEVAAVKPRAAYHIVDLAAATDADPERMGEMFGRLVAEVGAGVLRPLPRQVFAFDAAPEAFRHMAQARHIGKIVLVPQGATDRPAAERRPDRAARPDAPLAADNTFPPDRAAGPYAIRFREDASYLITGGMAGIGLAVAEWMVGHGARHLALVGRRLPVNAAREKLAAIEAAGARVMVAQGDVADAGRLAEILSDVAMTMPPLRGVIHSAGVLDDGALVRQDWARFATVLAPKVQGAWNLHMLTRDCDLDCFLLFSSAASVLGSAGQANHAAANAFLDALAQQRRAEGRPALCIDWGAWSRIGAAVRRGVVARAQTRGIEAIEPARGLAALVEVLRRNPSQVVVAPIDWVRFLEGFGAGGYPALLDVLAREAPARRSTAIADRRERGADGAAVRAARTLDAGSDGAATAVNGAAASPGPGPDLRTRLATAPVPLRREILLDFVAEQAARVLGLPQDHAIEPRQPLNDLGLDSLMAIELRNRLAAGSAPDQALPATLVFDHPTPEALAGYLMRGWAEGLPAPAVAGRSPGEAATTASEVPADDLLAAVEALSEEEIDRRFADRRTR